MDDSRIALLIIFALALAWAASDNWRHRKYRDATMWFVVAGLIGGSAGLMWLAEDRELVGRFAISLFGLMATAVSIAWVARKISGKENAITRIFDRPSPRR